MKSPRRQQDPDSANRQAPAWLFSNLDTEVNWGEELTLTTLRRDVLPRLQELEGQLWSAIVSDKKRNHSVSVPDLCADARKRVAELELDVDDLFRFRFDGTKRLWGIRDRHYFRVIWWDPFHKVCPSTKRS